MYTVLLTASALYLLVCLFIATKLPNKIHIKTNKLVGLNEPKNTLLSVLYPNLKTSLNSIREMILTNQDNQVRKLVNQSIAITETTYPFLNNILYWILKYRTVIFKKAKLYLRSIISQVSFNVAPLPEHKQIILI